MQKISKSTTATIGPQRRRFALGVPIVLFAAAFLSIAGEACAQGDDMARAKELFSSGQTAFEQGRYEEARKSFEESLAAFPHFRTLFNIGLCAEKLGDVRTAIDMYQRYVDWPSEVPNRDDVAKKIAELQATLPPEPEAPRPEEPEAAPEEPASPPGETPARERGPDLRVPGWIAVGTGAAGVIAGGVFLGLANGKKKDMEAVDGEAYDPAAHDAILEDGRTYEKVGWIAGGAGLLVAATGTILLLVSKRNLAAGEASASQGAPRVAVAPLVTDESAIVDVRWSF